MAAMALRLRPGLRGRHPPGLLRCYSSSNDDPGDSGAASKLFGDIKARLRQSSPPPPPRPPASPPPPPLPRPTKVASFDEIRKNLAEFRRRSAPPDPASISSSTRPPPLSFQEIYKNNLANSPRSGSDGSSPGTGTPGTFSFDAIRESLRHLRESPASSPTPVRGGGPPSQTLNPLSIQTLKESLKLRTTPTESIKGSIFNKELADAPVSPSASSSSVQSEFVKMYSHKELGMKLRALRPEGVEGKEGNWFSLGELNERLKKLRVMEEKESESRIGGVSFKDLRDSLLKLREAEINKSKVSSMQRHSILSSLTGETTPAYMSLPPKEQLVERYFHPDNMSSEEKLKLELKRVREEFKMSESDCGSTRVQVAQLTTKIKHLSTVLHKKDKHSRKGLQEMVQRRKKLLKYLRRTDWDSYCFVLSKLGLRDNPDYKC